jgi:thiamine-phosphate pyrophosphorylase
MRPTPRAVSAAPRRAGDPIPRLIAITDRTIAGADETLARFAELGRSAQPGSVVFQLRDLGLPARERLRFGRALSLVARDTGQRLVVNDRIDVALLLAADGVHLGESGVETEDARKLLGPGALVSRACHDPKQLEFLDADAVLLSPVVESRKGRPALGVEALGQARRALAARPGGAPYLVALGGVSAANAAALRAAGADAVAAIGAVLSTSASVRALLEAVGASR